MGNENLVSKNKKPELLVPAGSLEVLKVAVLYALGYMFEHREKADYHELTLTLRSLLFAIREGVV